MNVSPGSSLLAAPGSSGQYMSPHNMGHHQEEPKDDVFSRPPVPGVNGLPRERKHRFSGNSHVPPPSVPTLLAAAAAASNAPRVLQIKVEPYSGPPPPPSVVANMPPLIKTESPSTSYRRFESYPPSVGGGGGGSPVLGTSQQNSLRRYSLPEYNKIELAGGGGHHDLAPLNLTRRCSSSELIPQMYHHHQQQQQPLHHPPPHLLHHHQAPHHHPVKREVLDEDHLVGGGGAREERPVEAVYRDFGSPAAGGPAPSTSGSKFCDGVVEEVYRGEFESGRRTAPDQEPENKKDPDPDGKSGSRLSGRTIIEFDGNDCVLCRVCGDKASGFHYGVHSCEGCKGFFRRSIQQKIQYRPCNKNQQCSILRINRNRCQYCRLKKCISAGMSRDAVRFGRVPKREKAKILAAMQSSKAKVLESRVLTEMADERKIIDTIVRAHYDTCDYTVEKIKPFLARAHSDPKLTQCSGQRCPMKGGPEMSFLDEFSDRFMDHVRQVCTFAKLIPGFKCLQHEDQVTLLKSCVFEVLTVRLSGLFDNQSLVCLNGDVIRRETISAMPAGNAKFLMDNVFELTQRINRFSLSDAEIGLFCAVVIISADRPGLRNPELVGRMQSKLKNILQSILVPQHPHHTSIFTELISICQDLRTLNTLHTEKFLQQAKVMRDELGGAASSSPVPHHPLMVVGGGSQSSYSGGDRDGWEDGASITDRDSTGSRSPQSSSDSPATSHSFSMEDLRRSPLGSVSSSESIANSETFSKLSVNDLKIHGSVLLNALTSPALSQQLSSSAAVMTATAAATTATALNHHHHQSRKRELSRSDSGTRSHNQPEDAGSGSNVVGSQDPSKCPYKARKLDSPSDSGIDSPKAQGSHSTNTSVCSSPRSSMEDGGSNQTGEEGERSGELEEQHPLLKRALQQPPQPFNMGSVSNFQDEVYKPHKKFRHSDRKDGDEPTSTQGDGGVSPGGSSSASSLVHSHSILASQLAAPPTYRRSSPPPQPPSHSGGNVSSSQSGPSTGQQQSLLATTLSRSGGSQHHHHPQSLLATTLSRPVAVARAKIDEERSELLANLILDSGRYRPNQPGKCPQSLLMCATPLPAHSASEPRPWSPAAPPSAGQQSSASAVGGGRHIPVPVAPSHSTSTATSLSSPRAGGGSSSSAGPSTAAQKKADSPTAEDPMPLNLSVKPPSSCGQVTDSNSNNTDNLTTTTTVSIKQEPGTQVAVDSK